MGLESVSEAMADSDLSCFFVFYDQSQGTQITCTKQISQSITNFLVSLIHPAASTKITIQKTVNKWNYLTIQVITSVLKC